MPIHIPPGGFDKPEIYPPQMMALLRGVEETIDRIRYSRLKGQLLQGANPEINTDREVLVTRMEQLGFRPEIVGSLHEVDRKLYSAGTALDFKGCMELVRTIFEKIVQDAAERTAGVKGGTLPGPGASHFASRKQFLLSKGILTDDEAEMFQKLYNYVSNAGAHELGSAPEQARLTKNMVIECAMLLVGRVQTLIVSRPTSASAPGVPEQKAEDIKRKLEKSDLT